MARQPRDRIAMYKPVSLFTLTAAIIIGAWWWLGTAVPMPPSPLDPGDKLYCISYAPFRGAQSPLDLSTKIHPAQIEADLAQLSKVTDCVRTYSVDFGLDNVPEIAQRYGLKVLLGLWVSSHADRTQYQISNGVALANRFPGVVRAVIVGNEVLLRGEVSPAMLAEMIRGVKARVKMPVTYADVWEFWLRYRELAGVVDFVTIHILPYWEDEPVAARDAASHVDAIRKRVVENFPTKEIVIGEVGWPSAGRMREGALPSPANQALVITDILTRGKQEHFRVNVIEAFDQPWKRALEGTVGGHWGLFDDATRRQKFTWGMPVTNHPHWPWHAAGGVVLAALVFSAAIHARRRNMDAQKIGSGAWCAIALNAGVAGVLAGWTIENVPIESLGIGGWLRGLSFAALAIAVPIAGAAAMALSISPPAFARIIGPTSDRVRRSLALALGILLMVLTVLAVQSALALSFSPRYRDFPFAPLTAAAVPFLLLSFLARSAAGPRPLAETVAAGVLALSAVFIVWNETFANWQALWFATALGLVAVSLLRPRVAPG
jgi:exo-beta-1,3-glucanase (GH17 family)